MLNICKKVGILVLYVNRWYLCRHDYELLQLVDANLKACLYIGWPIENQTLLAQGVSISHEETLRVKKGKYLNVLCCNET